MNSEKNTLRDKLGDFQYEYREGAWEQFEESYLLPANPSPSPPPDHVTALPPRTRYLWWLAGAAMAGLMLTVLAWWRWPARQTIEDQGITTQTDRTADRVPDRKTTSSGRARPDAPTASSSTAPESLPAINNRPHELNNTPTEQTRAAGNDKNPASESRLNPPLGSSGTAANKTANVPGSKPGAAKSGDDVHRNGLMKDQSGGREQLEYPVTWSRPYVPAITAPQEAAGRQYAALDFLPAVSLSPLRSAEALHALKDSGLIRPFQPKLMDWKKHEAGIFVDILGPIDQGIVFFGGEYLRNWNSFTQTGFSLSGHYVPEAYYQNGDSTAAYAIHCIATQYVSLLQRPNWHIRLGVGYRLSVLGWIKTSNDSVEPEPFEADEKRGFTFTAEIKRYWRQNYWFGLQLTAIRWAPNLNLCFSRQF